METEKDCGSVAQRTSFAGVSQEASSQVNFLAKNGADGLWHAAIFLAEAVVSLGSPPRVPSILEAERQDKAP